MKALLKLMMKTPSLNEKEVLFQFMDRLQPWAKQELHVAVFMTSRRSCP